MFDYKGIYEINSAVPFKYIESYFFELGAVRLSERKFIYDELTIEVTECESSKIKAFILERNIIRVFGDDKKSEQFLNNFRLKFLSAGG